MFKINNDGLGFFVCLFFLSTSYNLSYSVLCSQCLDLQHGAFRSGETGYPHLVPCFLKTLFLVGLRSIICMGDVFKDTLYYVC